MMQYLRPPVSSFAPGTMIAVIFCFAIWAIISFINLRFGRRFIGFMCSFMAAGYALGTWKYLRLFYEVRNDQDDTVMFLLFLQMFCHAVAAIGFLYFYREGIRRVIDDFHKIDNFK